MANGYLWKDGAPDGGPPNNWRSRFIGESAWEWDERARGKGEQRDTEAMSLD
ncbi:MAG: hypothetical protein KDD73_05825 [Anaerolineales bacterium]|nr:hypothetical protein [Anaerolineales bacterium]MCB9128733.1 hypothetical protein [Ardenticatenales bacterium]